MFRIKQRPRPTKQWSNIDKRDNHKNIMSLAAEAEIGALYLNAKEAVYLRQILVETGHPQPPTLIQTDNTTAEGVINNKFNPSKPKQWICAFIGCATVNSGNNSEFIGDRGGKSGGLLDQTPCTSPPRKYTSRIFDEGQRHL